MPRAALGGRTPDEVFSGRAADLPERLAVAHRRACADRIQFNQARASCGGCDGPGHPTRRGEVVDG
ncbi:MAG: hypothetical protein H6725_20530 [Sandaracinaceae bacterium]|nr:hypothetical protein [Sandaracinaceae bacterium]